MEPDTPPTRDAVERAHLRPPGDDSHVLSRYPPPDALAGLVQRFWVPVWRLPPGRRSVQRVLQYPVALIVVTPEYSRFYGVTTGLGETVLTGAGWAVGVLCTPAAGSVIAGGPMSGHTDRHVDVAEVLGPAGVELTHRVRAAMAADPHAVTAHHAAIEAFADALGPLATVVATDTEGRLVEDVVRLVESRPDLLRVAQVCAETGLSERALQRLVHRRLGLTPKWLLQRRRLQEAADRLRTGDATAADIAATLGYADQAHFVRDFRRITGTTPGAFAATHRSAAPGPGH